MATRSRTNSPWPSQTPSPASPPTNSYFSTSDVEGRSVKRRRVRPSVSEGRGESSVVARQVIAGEDQIEKARYDCQFLSGNEVISCFPARGQAVPQHQWATFVWNSRRPELTQTNRVNIYLLRADSREPVLSFLDQPNPTDQAGVIRAQVDDIWFGADGMNYKGGNVSYPFYWAITRADRTLDGNEIAQPIFTAVQTTVADVVASSSSAAAAAASSSSLASLSSAALSSSLASISSSLSSGSFVTTIDGTATTLFPSATGNVQSDSNSDSFPRWAIAVIVVLGFFAIVATGILIFFILRRVRRRRAEMESNRNSMNSASPMMANIQQDSPLLSPAALAPVPRPASLRRNDSHGGPAHSDVLHDGASGISGEGGPFSGADAAIMADAFRKMLRKPEFPPIGEGSSPESQAEGGKAPPPSQDVLNRELAEEGRDLRSVSSSRGVKVESFSDHGEDQHQH
ncbi:hypothetical protein D9611_007466 [Ephemerocybe angulata]|uniref:Uncharacterized protein n=1 Tax=Ephemerocybe angulata TaxID=980116 RepID=A0A8H5FKI5_9AGAR|nr:hypothetical protein D9611_007466 [Tulosesus angulatus]